MTHRKSSSRGFDRGSQRRLTFWNLGPGGDDIASMDAVVVASSQSIIYGAGLSPLIPNLTIVRTRGYIEFGLNAATAVGDGFQWAAGIAVVSLDSFTAGAASTPTPFDDIQWPGWLWHAQGALKETIGGGADHVQRVVIDSKAMRKIRLNEVVALFMQFGETGTAQLEVTAGSRMLVKLP